MKKIGTYIRAFFSLIKTSYFWKHFLLIILMFICLIFLFRLWLSSYTNHGQKIQLPNFVGIDLDKAVEEAESKSFNIVVIDSIYAVDKPPHLILKQIPEANQWVKEDRKIYVTITKATPDQISFGTIPDLYGKFYEKVQGEMKDNYQINCRIAGYIYDPDEPGKIMKVIYNGETIMDSSGTQKDVKIDIGATVDFILSKREGGSLPIPNLVCKRVDEARFFASSVGIRLEEIKDKTVTNEEKAFVARQEPEFAPALSLMQGETIKIYLTQERPSDCMLGSTPKAPEPKNDDGDNGGDNQ